MRCNKNQFSTGLLSCAYLPVTIQREMILLLKAANHQFDDSFGRSSIDRNSAERLKEVSKRTAKKCMFPKPIYMQFQMKHRCDTDDEIPVGSVWCRNDYVLRTRRDISFNSPI